LFAALNLSVSCESTEVPEYQPFTDCRNVSSCSEGTDNEGTALLMTSHDMTDVEQVCERVLFLSHGRLVADGTLSRGQARDVLDECLREPKRPAQVVAERGLVQLSDTDELATVVDAVMSAHPDDVAVYRAGDEKARKKKLGFFMQEALTATNRQGNPKLLRQLLEQRLES